MTAGREVEVRTWRGQRLLPRWRPASRAMAAVNSTLDRLVRPTVTVAGRRVSSYRFCGYVGLAVAIAVSQAVVAAHHLSPAVMALLTLTAVTTFLALVTVTKLVMGEELIVYYHHEIAVLTTTVTLLWVLDQPILGYLDAVMLGIGGFLLCGRVGCLLVGCCHGRPARLGARYRHEHAEHGFTAGYVGVRLLPVPVLESLAVTAIVVAGVIQVAGGAEPGAALVWYVIAYGAVRSWLELLRGDPGRPHAWGVSHGQWIALGMVGSVSLAVWTGTAPGDSRASGVALAATMAACSLAWARWRSDPGAADVVAPRHLAEVAAMLRGLAGRPPGLHVTGPTSAGIIISGDSIDTVDTAPVAHAGERQSAEAVHTAHAGQPRGADSTATAGPGRHRHYALSTRASRLSPAAAQALARVVLRLLHPEATAGHLLTGDSGVHHLLVPSPSAPNADPTRSL